jgi:serine/threonine protein kinase
MSEKETTPTIQSFRTTVYGKYFLLDRIAVGGMAEVFKAKTFGVRGFERLLVIKRILPHLSKDEDFVEMFIDEAKISVELSHANIVQVTDLGKIADNYFIAMEYIDGKDLRAILKKAQTSNRPLSVEQAVFITIEVCKGLDYAHRKKSSSTNKPMDIIHRDISPQNVMISYEGEVKVVDFGIAKTAAKINQTQAGVLKGKFGYMSPEQAMGLEVDQRTDIFSTGIILFEMLTGRRLFLGDTDFETLEKIKEAAIPPISNYNQNVPKELERIVLKALARDLSKRYSNVREMQVDLTKFFYSTYPEFTQSNLAHHLKKLFKDEIASERDKLKASISTLPIEGLIDSELAAHSDEQIVDSQESSQRSHDSRNLAKINAEKLSQGEDKTAHSRVSRLYEKTVGLIYRAGGNAGPGLSGWLSRNKHMTLGIIFSLVFVLSLAYIFIPKGNKIGTPERTPAPDVNETQGRQFNILSEPSGAKIYINGQYAAETPAALNLPLNQFIVFEFVKEGYERKAQKVFLTEQDGMDQKFTLSTPVSSSAKLKIASVPEGASINIDGKTTGLTTPATIENLTAGKQYEVEVTIEGYEPLKQKLTPESGSEKEINLNLVALETAIKIFTVPTGAKVILEGFKDKKSPAVFKDLEKGKTYKLSVSKPGYESVTRDLTTKEGSDIVRITLNKRKEEFGYLTLGATPWAHVYIDGVLIGTTPKLNQKISTGSHTVTFRHPSSKDITRKVSVMKDKNELIRVQMDVKE